MEIAKDKELIKELQDLNKEENIAALAIEPPFMDVADPDEYTIAVSGRAFAVL